MTGLTERTMGTALPLPTISTYRTQNGHKTEASFHAPVWMPLLHCCSTVLPSCCMGPPSQSILPRPRGCGVIASFLEDATRDLAATLTTLGLSVPSQLRHPSRLEDVEENVNYLCRFQSSRNLHVWYFTFPPHQTPTFGAAPSHCHIDCPLQLHHWPPTRPRHFSQFTTSPQYYRTSVMHFKLTSSLPLSSSLSYPCEIAESPLLQLRSPLPAAVITAPQSL